jgi:predicted O-methyltransferase YrrM
MRPPGPLTDGLLELIALLPEDAIIAEIGTYSGESAKLFLPKVKKLYCIDPWEGYIEQDTFETMGIPSDSLAAAEQIFNRLANENPDKIVKCKGTSTCMAMLFPDSFFDMVYIDGNHEYGHVKADIEAWFPKVKYGGILAGHDYCEAFDGVIKAVKEFLCEPDRVFPDTSWMKRDRRTNEETQRQSGCHIDNITIIA